MFCLLRRYNSAILCLLAALLVVVPLWFIRFPPLHDYPFHVARMAILYDILGGGKLAQYYEINSFFVPNSGLDIVVLTLSPLCGVQFATELAITIIFLIMIGGAYFLNASVFRKNKIILLLGSLLVYNSVFTMGFLSYLMGIGLLLWGVGLFLRWRNSSALARLAVGVLIGLILLLVHIVAFALYAIIIAGLELQANGLAIRAAPRVALTRLATSGLPIVLILFVFYMISPTASAVKSTIAFGGSSVAGILGYKLWVMRRVFAGAENDILDIVSSLFAFILVVAFFIIGKVRIAKEAVLALAFLCLTFLVAPEAALSGSYLNFRLPIAIAFVFLGFTEFAIGEAKTRVALIVFLFLVLGIRTAVVARDWKTFDEVEQQFVDAYSRLPPDSILLAARGDDGRLESGRGDPDWRPPVKHFASLAVVTNRIFVPSTFADPAQSTIRVRPEFADIYKLQTDGPVQFRNVGSLEKFIQDFRALARGNPPGGTGGRHWKIYLLLLDPQALNYPRVAGTTLIAGGTLFALYAIRGEVPEGINTPSSAGSTQP